MPVWRRLLLLPLPGLWSGRVPRWITFFARVEATVAVKAKVGVAAVGAEAVVAFPLPRTWGSFRVLVILRADGFFLWAGAAPGVVERWGWGSLRVPLGVAVGRRPSSTWLLGPDFAMALAPAVDFARLVLEAGGFPGSGSEWPGAVGLLLVAELPLWLPAADVPGILPTVVARLPVFGVLLPRVLRYLESLLNADFSPHLPPPGMILSR